MAYSPVPPGAGESGRAVDEPDEPHREAERRVAPCHVDVVRELLADDRELPERRVQHGPACKRTVGEHEREDGPEQEREQEQEREPEDRGEHRVRRLHGERPAVVVAVL